jgi:hypothetical protein
MKAKIFGLIAVALLFVGMISLATTQDVVAQAVLTQEGDDKGTLYGNAEGTKYCCKASDDKKCGAAACP